MEPSETVGEVGLDDSHYQIYNSGLLTTHITYIMQDISKLPEIDLDHYLLELKNKPLDERTLKHKVDRLFSISVCN